MINLLKGLFPRGGVTLTQPPGGQNVDQSRLPGGADVQAPFMKRERGLRKKSPSRAGVCGEDPYMYALPRWGKTSDSGNTPNGATSSRCGQKLQQIGTRIDLYLVTHL